MNNGKKAKLGRGMKALLPGADAKTPDDARSPEDRKPDGVYVFDPVRAKARLDTLATIYEQTACLVRIGCIDDAHEITSGLLGAIAPLPDVPGKDNLPPILQAPANA